MIERANEKGIVRVRGGEGLIVFARKSCELNWLDLGHTENKMLARNTAKSQKNGRLNCAVLYYL